MSVKLPSSQPSLLYSKDMRFKLDRTFNTLMRTEGLSLEGTISLSLEESEASIEMPPLPYASQHHRFHRVHAYDMEMLSILYMSTRHVGDSSNRSNSSMRTTRGHGAMEAGILVG
eukprot:scaffold73580_cov19-Tisochrysis_lutea.AAC.2